MQDSTTEVVRRWMKAGLLSLSAKFLSIQHITGSLLSLKFQNQDSDWLCQSPPHLLFFRSKLSSLASLSPDPAWPPSEACERNKKWLNYCYILLWFISHLHGPLELVVPEELVQGRLLEEVRPLETARGPQRGRLRLPSLGHVVQNSRHILACNISD